MKKNLIVSLVLMILVPASWAQVNKTQLSLNVQEKYAHNFAEMANYTWQRTTQVYMKGDLKATVLSSVTLGSDGKPVVQELDKTTTTKKKPGVRGAIQKSETEDLKEYVAEALVLVANYIFMSKGEMVDLFDKGTVSELGNDLQVQGFNKFVQGDNLKYLYNISTLNCVSQSVSTIMNGDPVKAEVTYTQVQGVNMISKITLDLPAKGLNAVAVNSDWAKKL